jgi:hypothetical protein
MHESELKNNVPREGMPTTIRKAITFILGDLYAEVTYISILHNIATH